MKTTESTEPDKIAAGLAERIQNLESRLSEIEKRPVRRLDTFKSANDAWILCAKFLGLDTSARDGNEFVVNEVVKDAIVWMFDVSNGGDS